MLDDIIVNNENNVESDEKKEDSNPENDSKNEKIENAAIADENENPKEKETDSTNQSNFLLNGPNASQNHNGSLQNSIT